MPEVDADDDSVTRYVIWHFRYDPHRHERGNVVVAAFDREEEWLAVRREMVAELRLRQQWERPRRPRASVA
jgi:hypothetical protein